MKFTNYIKSINPLDNDRLFVDVKVQEVIHHTTDIFELRLSRENLIFTPGDCVSIYIDKDTCREYSIASGVAEEHLSFLIKHLNNGIVTEYLQSRHAGDIIKISQPYGSFQPGMQHEENNFVFIASGTGIAPFLSYIRSYPQRPPDQFLYGVRYLGDAIGFTEFAKVCSSQLAISRENINEFHHGRVLELLDTISIHPHLHVYLCGLDKMIEDASRWLINNHLPPENIHQEVFFYASPQQ